MKSLRICLSLLIFVAMLVAATAGFPGDDACLMDSCSADPQQAEEGVNSP